MEEERTVFGCRNCWFYSYSSDSDDAPVRGSLENQSENINSPNLLLNLDFESMTHLQSVFSLILDAYPRAGCVSERTIGSGLLGKNII